MPHFKKYPSLAIDVRCCRVPSAVLVGVYRDGSEKSYNVTDMSSQGIWVRMHRLVNTAHDEDVPFSAETFLQQRRRVQGTWNPGCGLLKGMIAAPQSDFDRRLTHNESDYNVDFDLRKETAPYEQQTHDVAERWEKYVTPSLQSDMEHSIAHMKRQAAAERPLKPPTMGEYSLFSAADTAMLAQDTLNALRRKDFEQLPLTWWEKRRQQLKPQCCSCMHWPILEGSAQLTADLLQ